MRRPFRDKIDAARSSSTAQRLVITGTLLALLTAPAVVLYRDLSHPAAAMSDSDGDAAQDPIIAVEQLLSLRSDRSPDQSKTDPGQYVL